MNLTELGQSKKCFVFHIQGGGQHQDGQKHFFNPSLITNYHYIEDAGKMHRRSLEGCSMSR